MAVLLGSAALPKLLPGKLAEAETTAILQEHVENAKLDFATSGFTKRQAVAIAKKPRLEAAFEGERIDTFFKRRVLRDPRLAAVRVTPRFKFGPDVFDPVANVWWDVTNQRQWLAHVTKYNPQFGKGIPLYHK